VIILVEIKTQKKRWDEIEKLFEKKYAWIVEEGNGASKGVAIGVIIPPPTQWKGTNLRPMPLFKRVSTIMKNEVLGVRVCLNGIFWSIVAVYRHANSNVAETCNAIAEWANPRSNNIVGGDWNIDPNSPSWTTIEEMMSKVELERIEWNHPTHYLSGCIDHLMISSQVHQENPVFLTATPTPMKDHWIMTMKAGHGPARGKRRSIPDDFFEDSETIATILKLTGKFGDKDEDGRTYLHRLKNTAKKVWLKRSTRPEPEVKDLTALQDVMHGILSVRRKGYVCKSLIKNSPS